MPAHRDDEDRGPLPEQIVFGENLRARRRQLGLTQVQLANLIGTRQHYISEVENGQANLTIESMVMLCRALGSDVWTFLKPHKRRRLKPKD